MKPILLFCLFFQLCTKNSVQAQQSVAGLVKLHEHVFMDANRLTGVWESMDSVKNRINIIDSLGMVIITPKVHINHYSFIKDTEQRVSVRGVAANWPPYDCILHLKDKNTLQISYFRFYDEKTSDVTYTKVK